MSGSLRWTGYETRLLRTALRMSLRAFAAHLGVAERTVSNWEKGGSGITPWPETQVILDTALAKADDATRARFTLALEPHGSRLPVVAAYTWDVVATLEQAMAITEEGDPVPPSRRDILNGAAGIAGTALATELRSLLLPAMMVERRQGKPFVEAELDAIELLVTHFSSWHSANVMSARRTILAHLKAHIGRLSDASQGTAETRRAFRIGAELARLAAAMHWDVELHATAQRCFTLSAQLAHAIGDEALAASALAALARQCFDLGRPEDGLEVVRLAQYGSRHRTTPRLKALLATREAWAYALLGDSRAFRRTVAVAEDHFAEGDRDSDHQTPGVRGLDLAELSGIIGARYRDLSLADPRYARTAQEYIGRALSLRDSTLVRNCAFDLIGLARAHLITREPEQAAALVHKALSISGSRMNGRVGTRLRVFFSEASPFSAVPSIRDARQAIAERTSTATAQ